MKAFILLVALISFAAIINCGCSKELNVGDTAPQFALTNQQGDIVSLTDFKGTKVTLYFYPADNTPGCTEQACSLRDGFELLNAAGIHILGLSKGSLDGKQKFIAKQHLNFPLLIATKDILKAYGVNKGIWYFFFGVPKRWTFLVNEEGIIVAIIKNVDTKNHAQQIIDAFNTIK